MTSNQTVIQISMMECKSHCRQEQGYTMEGTILLNRHTRVGSEMHFRDTDRQHRGQDEQLAELLLNVEQSRQNSEKGKEEIC